MPSELSQRPAAKAFSRVVMVAMLVVSLSAILVPPAVAQTECIPSGAFFQCTSTLVNVSATVTCPGTTRTATGKVDFVRATESATTLSAARANAEAAARREADRIAQQRAFDRCRAPVPVRTGFTIHSVTVGSVVRGVCRRFGTFDECEATAANTAVIASCTGAKRRVTGKVKLVTATEVASTASIAIDRALATARREAERIATERALARLKCR